MEPTNTQLEKMEVMEEQYKKDMAEVEAIEAIMFADDEIEAPKAIDPNGPEEFIDTPETTTEIFSGDPITCPEPPQAAPGTFLHWLACQSERDDPIGDLARDYINDVKYEYYDELNQYVECGNYDKFSRYLDSIGGCDGAIEALMFAKIEFDDFQEEEATHRDEQHMLELQKKKRLGC